MLADANSDSISVGLTPQAGGIEGRLVRPVGDKNE
jgi:hypothetical protein